VEDKPQEDDEDESISEEHHARKEQDEFANEEYFDNLIKKQNPKKIFRLNGKQDTGSSLLIVY
jgi:hypothetical protein